MKSVPKTLSWCIWGTGSVAWVILIIQLVVAKNETVIIESDSNTTLNHSVAEEIITKSDKVQTPIPVDTISNNNIAKAASKDNSSTNDPLNSKGSCVNVNSATPKELISLKGIGPVLAERIVAFRQKNGSFKNASDLIKVKGIGEGKLGKIKDNICF